MYTCIHALHNNNVPFWQRILQQSNFRVKISAEWSRYTAIHQWLDARNDGDVMKEMLVVRSQWLDICNFFFKYWINENHEGIFLIVTDNIIFLLANNDDDGFDLIRPSLIQQLRTILDQYPDDGQILKVWRNQSALWANSWIDTWFFWLFLMLSGLGNFVVDCHI